MQVMRNQSWKFCVLVAVVSCFCFVAASDVANSQKRSVRTRKQSNENRGSVQDRPLVRHFQERLRQKIESAVQGIESRDQDDLRASSAFQIGDNQNATDHAGRAMHPYHKPTSQPPIRVANGEAAVVRSHRMLADLPEEIVDRFLPRFNLGLELVNASPLQGVLVENIRSESPASFTGLEVGDRLVSVNQNLVSDLDSWEQQIRKYGIQEKVSLLVVRDGKLIQMHWKLWELKSLADSKLVRGADLQSGSHVAKQPDHQFGEINQNAVHAASAVGQAVLSGLGAAFDGLFPKGSEGIPPNPSEPAVADIDSKSED